MPAQQTCGRCGAPLSVFSKPGLCSSCLLRAGLIAGLEETTAPCPQTDARSGAAPAGPETSLRHFGDYELLEEIAHGGMGVVYKARQISLNRVVALKMILSGRLASAWTVERFRTEAEAAARLEHPNIVPIYEVGELEGAHYLTMRLIEGCNLRQATGGKPLSMNRAAELIEAVARAMHYAHCRGVLHRDLKPANVLLDGAGQPHVTDFGLAKLAASDTGITRSEAVMGTPNYMAPEQAAGHSKQATAAVDIYSLGAILYELLTGRPPFRGGTEMEVLLRVMGEEPRTPRSILPKLDRGLETICLKCLEKEPQRRYRTAEELADDLARWLRHEPIQAQPSVMWERAAKWARRRPLQATLGTVITLSAIVASLLWSEASRQRMHVAVASRRNAMKEVEELFEKRNSGAALARLARLLRDEPANTVAASRLLAALTQRSFALPAGELIHGDEVLSAEYSPDGRWIVTASRDRTARIWNAQTARLSLELAGQQGEVRCARFSPDSQRVVTGSEDGTARLWDVAAGRSLGQFSNHESAVRWAEFSPSGQSILTVATNVIRVWQAGSGQLITKIVAGQNMVRAARFSPDGEHVVTASQDGVVQIRDARNGEPVSEPLRHGAAVRAVQFSPDGLRVITASDDEKARIWTWGSGEIISLGHSGIVSAAQFGPDGQRVVTACHDGIVRIWDARSGTQVSADLRHEKQVNFVVFSPDALSLLSAGDDGTVRLWDADTGQPLAEPVQLAQFVEGALFRPNGRQFLTWSSEPRVRLWQMPAPRPLVRPLPRFEGITWVEFSPDGQMAVTVSNWTVILWDTQRAQPLGEPQTLDFPIQRAQFDADGRRLLIVSGNHVRVGDVVRLGSSVVSLRHEGPVQAAEFSQDGRWIVTVWGNIGSVWDARTGAKTGWTLRHDEMIESANFNPDAKRLVTASRDHTARIWEVGTGRFVSLAHSHPVLVARFSGDGQRVATGASDGTARIWDARSGRALAEPLLHHGEVNSVAFSPDGQRVVTAAADQTIRVWDARTGQPLTDPLRTGEGVWGARFTTCGRWVVTQSGLMWEVPVTQKPVPAWLAELAEGVAGQHFEHGNFAPVLADTLQSLAQRLQLSTENDAYTRWIQWFLADSRTRTISPSARMTVPEYVERQILANTRESLQEAVRLSPTNARARTQLSQLLTNGN